MAFRAAIAELHARLLQDVDNRNPGPLEIIVSNGAGVVDGVVTDGNSKPYSGAVVALVPDSHRFENRALFATAASDASGRFVFRGIAPGEYWLFAWETTPPILPDADGRYPVAVPGKTVTV